MNYTLMEYSFCAIPGEGPGVAKTGMRFVLLVGSNNLERSLLRGNVMGPNEVGVAY